jgi:hypothetical protein
MAVKRHTEDWAKSWVLFFLAVALVIEGAEFLWLRLPPPVRDALRWFASWIVLNKPALYSVLAVALLLTLFAGAGFIWRYLWRRGLREADRHRHRAER